MKCEFTKFDLQNDFPVAMYDVADKKMVAVFRSKAIASKYCFNRPNAVSIKSLLNKTVHIKSFFGRRITFRTANDDQKKLLDGHEWFVIIDQDSRFMVGNHPREEPKLLQASPLSLEISENFQLKKEKAMGLFKEGYSTTEVGEMVKIGSNAISRMKKGIYVTPQISILDKEELTELIRLLTLRRDRMEAGV